MRRLGGLLLVAVGVALLVVANVDASSRKSGGFDAMVKALSEHYSVHPKKIPLMWAVSLCARGATHGGVRGMRIAQFDHFGPLADQSEFEAMVASKLGDDWTPTVREHESNGNESLVYTREDGRLTEFVVITLDHGELNAVRMEMNPEQLSHWVNEREQTALHETATR